MDYYIYDLAASAAEAGTATVLFFAMVYFTGQYTIRPEKKVRLSLLYAQL